MRLNFFQLIVLIFIALAFSSCGRAPRERIYTEILDSTTESQPFAPFASASPSMDINNQDTQTQMMLKSSMSNIPLSWGVPDGWVEQAGSGMRMATFTGKGVDFECSLVSMAGGSGGMEANVIRWAGQLGIDQLTPAQIQVFLKSAEVGKTAGGFPYTLVDFTKLQESLSGNAESMFAAIIDVPGSSVFVKMTGTKKTLADQARQFKSLVTSLSLHNE